MLALIGTEAIVSIVVVSLLLIGMSIWFFSLKNKIGKSYLEDIFSTEKDIVVLSNIYNAGGELSDSYEEGKAVWINKETGKVEARHVIGAEYDKMYLAGPLLIMDCENRFVIIDQRTYQIVFNYKILKATKPQLVAEGIYEMRLNEESQSISIKSKKGKTATIQLQSFSKETLPPYGVVQRSQKEKHTVLNYSKSEFLKPKTLMGNEDFYIVLHKEDITPEGDFMISKATDQGEIAWTIKRSNLHPFKSGEIKVVYSETRGNDLIVGLKANRSLVFCIDTEKGEVKWKYKV